MDNHSIPDDQLVERLHSLLAQALQGNRPQPFDSPVTVAEIYQDLVPYRTVRSALGFQMNADYEHTLLRMLAGEGGLARLEPAEARDELRSELDTPNPNVGLFRKFAGCDVWVTPGQAAFATPPATTYSSTAAQVQAQPGPWDRGLDPGPIETNPDEWESALPELILDDVVPAEPTPQDTPSPEPAPEPAEVNREPEASTMIGTAASAAARAIDHSPDCAFCASALPPGRVVKFCPFCGMDQLLRPCRACAEPLAPDWQFCIMCGSSQEAASAG